LFEPAGGRHGRGAAHVRRPVALAQSDELDDAPGFERFVLVAADERRLELPESMDQFSLVVRKEPYR